MEGKAEIEAGSLTEIASGNRESVSNSEIKLEKSPVFTRIEGTLEKAHTWITAQKIKIEDTPPPRPILETFKDISRDPNTQFENQNEDMRRNMIRGAEPLIELADQLLIGIRLNLPTNEKGEFEKKE